MESKSEVNDIISKNRKRKHDYKKRVTMSVASTPHRLEAKQWGHFSRKIQPTNAKKNPQRKLSVYQTQKKSETIWECKKCLVPLHVPDCFGKYQTLHDY